MVCCAILYANKTRHCLFFPCTLVSDNMYKPITSHQITFNDFNQSCGMQLSLDNEWCVLAGRINWDAAEKQYAQNFPSRKGHPAIRLRQALGALVIQKRMGLSDRALVKSIAENPYYQYFIGLQAFSAKCPFTPTTLVGFRKRIGMELLVKLNEMFLSTAQATPEHKAEKAEKPADGGNIGTMILDATCSPSNIRRPQDFSLLNEAREKTDAMIDGLHAQFFDEGRRPRTYRRVMRAACLEMAKSKKRTAKKIRALVRRQLCSLERNLGFVSAYLAKGGKLPRKSLAGLGTIRELHRQQKQMFDSKIHRVEDRIVSAGQPYIRPIVRGKAKAPVEFGAKYDVGIDGKGHARLEKLSFNPYNESGVFCDAAERYKARTGHYPRRALVDKIYRTRENREFCKANGIQMSGRAPGRPGKDAMEEKKAEHRDDVACNEVERFFSRGKRTCGAALIMTKLSETTLAAIALSVLVANLFGIPFGDFFVVYFSDGPESSQECHFCEFSDAVA